MKKHFAIDSIKKYNICDQSCCRMSNFLPDDVLFALVKAIEMKLVLTKGLHGFVRYFFVVMLVSTRFELGKYCDLCLVNFTETITPYPYLGQF